MGNSVCWRFAVAFCSALLLGVPQAVVAQLHSTGLTITKTCPEVANSGDTITCTVSVENLDIDHGVANLVVTNQVPFPGGVVTVLAGCAASLAPDDGFPGTGSDFTSCAAIEVLDQPCDFSQGSFITVADEASADGVDADPLPFGAGGYGGLQVSNATSNSVIVFCSTPTPTSTPTATPTRTATPGAGTGTEGCTPGYWKNHLGAWGLTGFDPLQSVESVFAAATAIPTIGSASLLDALGFGGGAGVDGAARILLRAAVAALLNAAHPEIDYPRSVGDIISDVDAALVGAHRGTMLSLATMLDEDNNLGCELGGDTCEGAALAEASAVVADQCSQAASRRDYRRCLVDMTKEMRSAGLMSRTCQKDVVKCARRSTVGRSSDAVICSRTFASGRRTCSVKRNADRCKAPRGGSACILADATNCCDPEIATAECIQPNTLQSGR